MFTFDKAGEANLSFSVLCKVLQHCQIWFQLGLANFYWLSLHKTGKNIPNANKIYQMDLKYSN
jgi:hypothetical protein